MKTIAANTPAKTALLLAGLALPAWLLSPALHSAALNSFANGDVADADQVNANFESLKAIHTQVAFIRDVQAANTLGGDCGDGGVYVTRALNDVSGDQSFVSLNANQFTVQPGTYEIYARAPAYRTDEHNLRLRDVTGTPATIITGAASLVELGDPVQTDATLMGQFTISSPTIYELQHYFTTCTSVANMGRTNPAGPTVFAEIRLQKLD